MLDDRSIVAWTGGASGDPPPLSPRPSTTSVESIVAAALAPAWRRSSPDAGDASFEHADGTRLVVRHSAAKTSWATRKPCGAQWTMVRRGASDREASPVTRIAGDAGIHVLCHHPIWSSDHRDPAQWRFYVIAAHMLPGQDTLSLPAAALLARPVAASDLAATVDRLRRAGRHSSKA